MQTILSLSRAALIVAAATVSLQAQCFDTNTGSSIGTGDDTVLPAQTLPFAFPFNGATYNTIHPVTNGFVYLSNGTTTGGALCCTGVAATMAASPSPMIAPWWTDLNIVSGTGTVKVSSSPSGAVVTWENAIEYGGSTATGQFSVQLQLFPSGQFNFCWDSRTAITSHTALVGMSPGSGAVLGAATDFSVGGLGATNTNFQLFGPAPGAVSVTNRFASFFPTLPGFVWVSSVLATNCATNASYGTGCYNLRSSFYQFFADAPTANAALQGNAMLLSLAGSGYVPAWVSGGAALYVAPTGAAVAMGQDDDGDTAVTLPSPLPVPGGTVSNLVVSHNGIVTFGAVGNNSFDYNPTGPEMASASGAAFYPGWHDWVDADSVGTGRIKTEVIGSTYYITWDNVENYPTGVANPGTMQIQMDLSSGLVTYVWTAIDTSTASSFGTAFVVGYKAAGAQPDPGSINLATSLPALVPNTPVLPLTLVAGPNPVSTPSSGTVVTFTTSQIPQYAPGIYVALHIISVGQVPAPGLDLGFIGAPGCPSLVQSLDLTQAMVGVSSTQSVTFAIPAGVTPGFQIFSQSASLNQLNAFGITTSNGVASTIQPQ